MASKTYTLKQGDLFQKSVQFNLTGHDFTGSTVRCSLRDSGGKVVQDLTIGVGFLSFVMLCEFIYLRYFK